jgi:predicted short-subunit dehydrogenase-like oxidoreductase (DUF2520 family)
MKLSIIGAGRVGQTLGLLARLAGFEIGDIVCRSKLSAKRAVQFIGAGRPQPVSDIALSPTDLILIATPDDKIEDAVRQIQSNVITNTVVLHTSGALSSEILNPLKGKKVHVGSCHPLQSFTSSERNLALIRKTYFCIEGDAQALRLARRLVKSIGAHSFAIKTEMKGLYHAAAVLSSGGVTTLLSMALELLGHCGLKEAEARKVLLPLVEGTLANIQAVGAKQALTGPVRRGDVGTVRKNLRALQSIDKPALEIYRLLALRSLSLAEGAGTDKKLLAQINRLLKAKPQSR